MNTNCYYKKGAPVIYHFQERRKVYWSQSGYGYVNSWKRATLTSHPRDENGRFTNDENRITLLFLKDENGNTFQAYIDDVERDRDITTLSREELVKLRKEIVGGSIYTNDYRNSLGVFEDTVCDYYDAFWQYLCSYADDEETAEEMDTPENFAEYILDEYATAYVQCKKEKERMIVEFFRDKGLFSEPDKD